MCEIDILSAESTYRQDSYIFIGIQLTGYVLSRSLSGPTIQSLLELIQLCVNPQLSITAQKPD